MPKILQYLMGQSDIGVTLNTYTHLGLEDAQDELSRIAEIENACKEMDKLGGCRAFFSNKGTMQTPKNML